jgi:peptide deformylase
MWKLYVCQFSFLLSQAESLAPLDWRRFGEQVLAVCSMPVTLPVIASEPLFRYSDDWSGTQLNLRSLQESVLPLKWPMGRWPDSILRRPASPVDPQWYASATVQTAATLLKQTARREGAVGLAAQQCGVDARMVFVEGRGVLVNPHIVARSPETEMKVWQEECLVLPPSFVATVLRDSWVDVEYWTVMGKLQKTRLSGELSRCLQHEMGMYHVSTLRFHTSRLLVIDVLTAYEYSLFVLY